MGQLKHDEIFLRVAKIGPFREESILAQGQLQIWTEHSTLIFENLKPVEKSKNHFSIN